MLTLLPTTLPQGYLGIPYSQFMVGSGGTPPYSYSVSIGTLPTGLSLNASTGEISGIPLVFGSFSFDILVTDAFTNTGNRYTLFINDQVFPNIGTCEAEIFLSKFNTGSGSLDISYYVPYSSIPITGNITVNGGLTIPQIQALLDLDPTRIASGYTITVVSFDANGLNVLISKNSSSQITDYAAGHAADFTGAETVTAPFICNLPIIPPNKGGGGRRLPAQLCFKRCYNYNKIPNELYPCDQYISFYGIIYELISYDQYKCCYKTTNKRGYIPNKNNCNNKII